jgi:NTE family protein
MKRKLAFALGGGGARGALQVGALRALFEAGVQPDLLVGTSIGAVNAAFLAIHGYNQDGIQRLVDAWHEAAQADLLPSNYLWLTVRALFNRPVEAPMHRMREFFIHHGVDPDLRFGDILGVGLITVAADLNQGSPLLFGVNPADRVLDGLIASTALPPWVRPLSWNDLLLIDGGAVSNLPIEPAITAGAGEIAAFDLKDFRDTQGNGQGFGPFLTKLMNTVEQRQMVLEFALAEAKRVQVHYLKLQSADHVPLWNFSHTSQLIEKGYELALQSLQDGSLRALVEQTGWVERLKRALG